MKNALKRNGRYGKDVAAPEMFETESDLPKGTRTELVELLNQRLADAIDLELQLRHAHWNVKGPSFIALHQLFEKLAEEIEGYVDEIAERIAQLGGVACGTVRMAAAHSRIEEYPTGIANGCEHITAVAKALSTFSGDLRGTLSTATALDDPTTADLVNEISRGVEKALWFVEAHVQAAN